MIQIRMTKTKLIIVIIALMLGIHGCGKSKEAGRTGQTGGDTTYQIAVIPGGGNSRHWQLVRAGALKAAEEHGRADLIWEALPEEGRQAQIMTMNENISRRVDGIILDPADNAALVNLVSEAQKAGIAVVIINSPLDGQGHVSLIKPDNEAAGRLAARQTGTITGGRGNLIMLRYMPGNAPATAREEAFLETVKAEFAGLNVLSADQYVGATVESALAVAENLLIRFPQVEAVFCPDEISTAGALKALRDIDKAGKIKLVAAGFDEKLLMALEKGDINALVVHNYFQTGYLAVKTLMNALMGQPVEKLVSMEPQLITLENIHEPDKQAVIEPAGVME